MRVLTLGTFDLIHAGHIGLFAQCRDIAGKHGQVVVAVNTDDFVREYKGHPPVIPLVHRIAVIAQLRQVDTAHPNPGGTAQPDLIADVSPNVIVIGDDWADRDYLTQLNITQDWLDTHNITVQYVPRTGTYSSSQIRSTHDQEARQD